MHNVRSIASFEAPDGGNREGHAKLWRIKWRTHPRSKPLHHPFEHHHRTWSDLLAFSRKNTSIGQEPRGSEPKS